MKFCVCKTFYKVKSILNQFMIQNIASHNGDKEERCYVTGRLDGTAKYFYTSGAVETRIYENGVLQGKAVKQSTNAEVEERNYVDGKLNGKATVLYPDSSKEMRTYKVIKLRVTGESFD